MAFFSYSTIDWDAKAEREVLHSLPDVIESQIRAEIGSRSFNIWRDQDKLRWGDEWRSKIHASIRKHNAMIVLVSPSWFKSDICQEEFDAFVRAPLQKNGLLLPILWRKVVVDKLSRAKRRRWDIMCQVTQANWTELCDVDAKTRAKILREYCRQVATKFLELGIQQPKSSIANNLARHQEGKVTGHPSSTIVSGGFALPSQAGGWATLKLVVSPMAILETDFGELVFSITGLNLVAEVNGGNIKSEAVRFGGAGFDGEVARVYRAPSEGANTYALTIERNAGPLAGEPLTEPGEAGHVEIFQVASEGSNDACVSGQVEFNPRSVEIDEEESMLDDDLEEQISFADRNARRIKRKLAKIIVEQCANRVSLLPSDDS